MYIFYNEYTIRIWQDCLNIYYQEIKVSSINYAHMSNYWRYFFMCETFLCVCPPVTIYWLTNTFFVCFPYIIQNKGYSCVFRLSLTWSVSHRCNLVYILAHISITYVFLQKILLHTEYYSYFWLIFYFYSS